MSENKQLSSKRLFVDMDGTLAKFHDEVNYLERMFEKSFFLNLKPFDNLIEAIKLLENLHPEMEVFVLSAVVDGEPPYCKAEKHLWLAKHLPEIDIKHRVFTDIGCPKADYIPGGVTSNDYLLDDYNIGLEQWQQAGGTAIKCKNNINHKGLVGSLWEGLLIDNGESPENIKNGLIKALASDLKYIRENEDCHEEDPEFEI